MSAFGPYLYPVTVRTDCLMGNSFQIPVKRNDCPDTAAVIFHQLAAAFQVAQALFTGVGNKQYAASDWQFILHHIPRGNH